MKNDLRQMLDRSRIKRSRSSQAWSLRRQASAQTDGRTVHTTNGAGPDLALDLVESRVDSTGVTIQDFRPAGRPQYATA